MTKGFTLLEMTIAMAVALVVAGAVFISVRGNNSDYRELHNAALQIQADLRYAQRRTVTEGRRIGVWFCDVNRDSYRVWTANPEYETIRTVQLPHGMTVTGIAGLDNHRTFCDVPGFTVSGRIMYTPRGTLGGRAGTIYLQNGNERLRITLTVGGGRPAILCYPEHACNCENIQ